MDEVSAATIIEQYIKQIFGFALKRCKCLQDAEDLSQEISLMAYRSLLRRNDILDIKKYIWTVAHNAISNYYRNNAKSFVGIPIDDLKDILSSDECIVNEFEKNDAECKLQNEIAFLTKMQRQIVIMYYYDCCKVGEIAEKLGLSVGTVKWHLFEARKELKKGMGTMRTTSELKFNPIKFDRIGMSGSSGSMGGMKNYFRTALSQNIVYDCYRTAKSINEIANDLGVSPVYIESEVDFLYENCLLTENSGKYLTNAVIDEYDSEIASLKNKIYSAASKMFINRLFDEIMGSGLLDCGDIYYPDGDKNFAMWALSMYATQEAGILDWSGKEISFDEAATLRPDGGKNIAVLSICEDEIAAKEFADIIKINGPVGGRWCGPCWNGGGGIVFWQMDSPWSDVRVNDDYQNNAQNIMRLMQRYCNDEELSVDELSFLALHGIIRREKLASGKVETIVNIVMIKTQKAEERLMEIGKEVRKDCKVEFAKFRTEFSKKLLKKIPNQMQTAEKFMLQYLFSVDGLFIQSNTQELLNCGRLKSPTEQQRKTLSILIAPWNPNLFS